jgi:hypothetical protein
MKQIFFLAIASLLVVYSCKKPDKMVYANEAPNYYGVPTIKVKNYINRIFIDLIGREPLNTEMDSLVSFLEANNLNFTARNTIIKSLQTDTVTQASGDSFKYLYYLRIYELQQARFVEGVPDSEFSQEIGQLESAANIDSLFGDYMGYQYKLHQADLYRNVLKSNEQYRTDSIDFNTMCLRMCYNGIYDLINMNSFNYVNAVFDNMYYRFPTQPEFTSSYDMVDANTPNLLFSNPGSSKYDFIEIITTSNEFNDGTVTWLFRNYLARFPTSTELYVYNKHYSENKDLQYIIKELVKSDEYANF